MGMSLTRFNFNLVLDTDEQLQGGQENPKPSHHDVTTTSGHQLDYRDDTYQGDKRKAREEERTSEVLRSWSPL